MWLTKNGYEIHHLLKGRSNSFLVVKNNKAILADTGRSSKRKTLTQRIDQFENLTIVALVLTHAHFDHAENAAYVKERYHVPIFIHKDEAGYLKKGENPPVRGSFFLTKFLTSFWETKIKDRFRYEPADYDFVVDDRFDLDILGLNCYLLHTPGHSQGSMSLIVDDEVAIVGDAMFGVIKKLIYPPFAEDPGQMVKSWGKLLNTGCNIFLPGHGTQNRRELIESQYKKFKSKSSHVF